MNQDKPKYQLIYEDLMADIRNGNFSYEEVFCTEKQLSEKYDVSRITAKRAITDLEQNGILYRKRGIGSFVSRNADAFSGSVISINKEKSKTVSFLLPFETTRGGIFDTVTMANQQLNDAGYLMNIYISNRSVDQEEVTLKRLLAQNISGLIYYPCRDKLNMKLLNEFLFAQIPVVILDQLVDIPYVSNVILDNDEAARLLTEHLIGLGHRQIAFLAVSSLEHTSSTRHRFGGYLDALLKNGITPKPQYYSNSRHFITEEEAENPSSAFCQSILQLHQAGATAIICENDYLAAYTLKACKCLGLSVPGDVSVCGFDNTSVAVENDLTTINQDFSLIGETIGRILTDCFRKPDTLPQKVLIPATLVVRGSSGPASKE